MPKKEKSESSGYGLLIASVVSIVAIVGLVILFKGGSTGRMVEMQSDWSPSYGLASTMQRGGKMGFAPDACGPGSVVVNDFNTGEISCVPTIAESVNRNYYRWNKGSREAEGGMMISGEDYEASTDKTINRGAYRKVVTEGLEKSTLPAASKPGIILG